LRAADIPCSGASSPQDIHFKLNHSDSIAVILEEEKQFSGFFSVVKDFPQIKNIILMDKIRLFSEKEDAPEWTTPIAFKDGEEISKKFKTEIELLIQNKNKFIFLSTKAKLFLEKYLEKNIRNLLKNFSSEENVDSVKNELLKRAMVMEKDYNKKYSPTIFSFDKINQIGKDLLTKGDTQFVNISKSSHPDDLATIIYTSGTTADPKGVMLTNSNFMHNVINAPISITINKDDNFLSVLPSWHVYERMVEYCALYVGASTAYSKPFKQVLLPDLKAEKPTVMCSVPRIWESLHKGILDKIKKGSNLQQLIFNWAIKTGGEYKEAEGILNGTWPLFDRSEYTSEELSQARRTLKRLSWKYQLGNMLVFKKIRELTGGRFRFAISGGGALNESIDRFFNIIGLIITEGYGLTETSPILAGRTKKDNIMFTVGPPILKVDIKIVDKDNLQKELPNGKTGIILTKGPMVMKGYYKNEEKTKDIIKDDWFNTGDLGKKTHNGKYLKIVGRIKDTIVLRGGENVEPLPLEDKLKESKYINMAIIVGQDKLRLGALIIPDFETLKPYMIENNIEYENIDELINHSKVISLYQKEQKRLISKENGFMPYETVMGIALLPHEFTMEAGEMTETLKMKRFEIHKKYEKEIDRICG
ncbi:MAG: AMP-binding protein, partial [Atribacterota bacterium]|nr:AMP-binding protein [Atribacterota bacterium]